MIYYKNNAFSQPETIDTLYNNWLNQTEVWNNLNDDEKADAIKTAEAFFNNRDDDKLRAKYAAVPHKPTARFNIPQFEVLNELRDNSSCKDNNVARLTRFLFECDEKSYAWQLHNANKHSNIICRAVFSGGKSIHCIIELDESCQSVDEYKDIWETFNQFYFDGNADKACCNPARLTRTPNAKRSDKNWALQKLLFENDHKFSRKILYTNVTANKFVRGNQSAEPITLLYNKIRTTHDEYRTLREKRIAMVSNPTPVQKFLYKRDCSSKDFILDYLNTPFLNNRGNGGASRTGLFKSIKYCQQHFDDKTLKKVIDKAKSENWTDEEIKQILDY